MKVRADGKLSHGGHLLLRVVVGIGTRSAHADCLVSMDRALPEALGMTSLAAGDREPG